MTMPASNQAAFDRLASEYLRNGHWTDIEVFTLIGNFAAHGSGDIAASLAFHARDVLNEAGENDVDYEDLACEIYRRTFFDPEQAAKYGTEHLASNEDGRLDHFVSYLVTQMQVEEAGANVIHFAPKQRM